MSSAFHHGEHEVEGYKLEGNKIVPVDPERNSLRSVSHQKRGADDPCAYAAV